MVKINWEIADLITKDNGINFGHYSKYGAVMGDAEFILYYPDQDDDGVFLAHRSEFEFDGIFVRLKEK